MLAACEMVQPRLSRIGIAVAVQDCHRHSKR
jgi:hypothetical protein